MPGKAAGRSAVDLPWLCPNTDSLVALAERPVDVPHLAANDAALTALLLRTQSAAAAPESFSFSGDRFLSPVILEAAATFLDMTPGACVPPLTPAATVGRVAAQFAARIASHTGRRFADGAAALAQIAPVGWYAVAVVDPPAARRPLFDPAFVEDSSAVQRQFWAIDHDTIARRLATRWRLPLWAATILGNLNLPFRTARRVVSEPDVFAVVQLAVSWAEECGTSLGLTRTADRGELLSHLGMSSADLGRLCRTTDKETPLAPSDLDQNPHNVPLLRNLLRATAVARRRNGASLVLRLEDRIDELYEQLAEPAGTVGTRLRDAKLEALAELAAGAGHEINNPLAVISGNAQRLIRTEQDADRGETLRSIVRQTQRIAGILRDLMQFARPVKPAPGRFAAVELMTAVRNDLDPVAAERGVTLELASAPADVWLDADFVQLRHVVAALVRNGVEAAVKGGWVRLGCETAGKLARFVVEDSGPGLEPGAVEHAFDPFYCGRAAGRGRGLGLPTAWQFARQNGADVRFLPTTDGPTRFVVSIPVAVIGTEGAERRSA